MGCVRRMWGAGVDVLARSLRVLHVKLPGLNNSRHDAKAKSGPTRAQRAESPRTDFTLQTFIRYLVAGVLWGLLEATTLP